MSPAIRDKDLLDALESKDREEFSGTVWRSVKQGRYAEECGRSGGRWDDRQFDVLYTSLSENGAIAERRFHLFRGQPFPPSKIQYELFQLHVELKFTITFKSLEELNAVGMNTTHYGAASYVDRAGEYPRSQEVAEACFFLGADGIIVPNARHDSLNLIVFCDQESRPLIGEPTLHYIIEW